MFLIESHTKNASLCICTSNEKKNFNLTHWLIKVIMDIKRYCILLNNNENTIEPKLEDAPKKDL